MLANEVETGKSRKGKDMNITSHAEKRMKQRGISAEVLALVEVFGTPVRADRDVQGLRIPNKVISETIEILSRCRDTVFATDKAMDRLITVFHTEKEKKVML